MTIELINGNVLDVFADRKINFLAHCCNMQNVMGAGIAKYIKRLYPEAYEADTKWFLNKNPDFSHMSMAKIGVNRYVANIYGQRYYGTENRQLNYAYLKLGLSQLARVTDGGDCIGLPYGMGCGLAGGDWDIVQPIIEEVFINHNVKIYKLGR
jgi:O-acetyl-ADP-ribose deacetylase (regulator of RNase III)